MDLLGSFDCSRSLRCMFELCEIAPPVMHCFVVGITGGSGSGKSVMAKAMFKQLVAQQIPCGLISLDWYYRDYSHLTLVERSSVNFDHPDSIEFDLLFTHILNIQQGIQVSLPDYDFTTHSRQASNKEINSKIQILIVEGMLLFTNPSLLPLFHLKVFMDCTSQLRLFRRISRDVKLRGRSVDSVLLQFINVVQPMHELFVEPTRKLAQVIVPHLHTRRKTLEVVKMLLSKCLVAKL
jgi:uridine kinase